MPHKILAWQYALSEGIGVGLVISRDFHLSPVVFFSYEKWGNGATFRLLGR